MSRSIRIASMAVLVLASAVCRAQPSAVERCIAIDDDRERLACYDAASGRARAPAASPASPSTTPSATATSPSSQPSSPPSSAPPAGTLTVAPEPRTERESILGEAWLLDDRGKAQPEVNFHRANYLLFARYSNNVNQIPSSPTRSASSNDGVLDATEAKFQISFKARLAATQDRRFSLWAAYTQQSHWQVYNSAISRPFRETNYMPEIIGGFRPDLEALGFRWRVLNLGLVHQSNGRADPLSRSWNRVYAEFGIERGNFALLVRPWYRLKENAADDDNPDITHYLGRGDITALYRVGGHSFSAMVRGGKGAAQVAWYSPPILGPLRGYVQVFSGYGESMIDYNWRQTTVGAGVTLSDRP